MPTAFVLSSDEIAGSDAFAMPGFPGVWTPGKPIEAAEFVKLGAFSSVDEMRDRVAELGLPLEEVEVAEGSAPLPARPNHHAGTAERVDEVVAEQAGGRITTHSEADRVAAKLGYRFPEDPRPTVAQKVEALDAIRAGAPQELAVPVDEVAERAEGAGS